MKFMMHVKCDNDAFFIDHAHGQESARGMELARILRDVADRLETSDDTRRVESVRDSNGNIVGFFDFGYTEAHSRSEMKRLKIQRGGE